MQVSDCPEFNCPKSKCPESKCPSIQSPSAQASSIQATNIQAFRVQASRNQESRHPESNCASVQSPGQGSRPPESTHPRIKSPSIQAFRVQCAGHCLYFWTSRSAGAIQPWKLLTVELSNCSDVSHNFFFVSKMWEFNAIFAN